MARKRGEPKYRRVPIVLSPPERLDLNAKLSAHGLHAHVFHSRCGSAYISVREAFDGGEEIALIRLSGHHEGSKKNATHRAIGDKEMCMKALAIFTERIVKEFKDQIYADAR